MIKATINYQFKPKTSTITEWQERLWKLEKEQWKTKKQ